MFRYRHEGWQFTSTSPHTRGDVPRHAVADDRRALFSPHTWGCSVRGPPTSRGRSLLPTHVGMFRSCPSREFRTASSPHTRGDVPRHEYELAECERFSPHTWGCSGRTFRGHCRHPLLPTHVGMFRQSPKSSTTTSSSPHTRGDVPWLKRMMQEIPDFSPHTWGCSGLRPSPGCAARLLPTHVGMFRHTA